MFKVANLQCHTGSPATLTVHHAKHCLKQGSSEILGYHYLPEVTDCGDQEDDSNKDKYAAMYAKAVAEAHKTACRAVDILNHAKQADDVSVTTTGRGLVGGLPEDGHVEAVTLFERINFIFPHPVIEEIRAASGHYLHFSCPTAEAVRGLLSGQGDGSQPSLESITIFSGMSLYTKHLLDASFANAKNPNASILEESEPTLYEVEYFARAVPAIIDLVRLLAMTNNHNSDPGRTLIINLDIPRFHYYQSLDDRLRAGTCTFEIAMRWMLAASKRHMQISYIFRRLIVHGLAKYGLTGKCSVEISPFTHLVYYEIMHCLMAHQFPTVDRILKVLDEGDFVWQKFFGLVRENDRPQDFNELSHLCYVYQVVRPALKSVVIDDEENADNDSGSDETIRPDITSDKAIEADAADDKTVDGKTADDKAFDSKPVGQVVDNEVPDDKSFEDIVHDEAVDEKPFHEKTTDDKAVDQKATDAVDQRTDGKKDSEQAAENNDHQKPIDKNNAKPTPPPSLLVSVDDSIERLIYTRAQQVLKRVRALPKNPANCHLLETYLCPKIFINGNKDGSNLYLDDPSPELPLLKTCSNVSTIEDSADSEASDSNDADEDGHSPEDDSIPEDYDTCEVDDTCESNACEDDNTLTSSEDQEGENTLEHHNIHEHDNVEEGSSGVNPFEIIYQLYGRGMAHLLDQVFGEQNMAFED